MGLCERLFGENLCRVCSYREDLKMELAKLDCAQGAVKDKRFRHSKIIGESKNLIVEFEDYAKAVCKTQSMREPLFRQISKNISNMQKEMEHLLEVSEQKKNRMTEKIKIIDSELEVHYE